MQEKTRVELIKTRAGIVPSHVIVNGSMYTILYTMGISMKIKSEKEFLKFVTDSIVRHASGDWGDLDQEDKECNDRNPSSAMSTYVFDEDNKIWIKTEMDRIIVLFPEEY